MGASLATPPALTACGGTVDIVASNASLTEANTRKRKDRVMSRAIVQHAARPSPSGSASRPRPRRGTRRARRLARRRRTRPDPTRSPTVLVAACATALAARARPGSGWSPRVTVAEVCAAGRRAGRRRRDAAPGAARVRRRRGRRHGARRRRPRRRRSRGPRRAAAARARRRAGHVGALRPRRRRDAAPTADAYVVRPGDSLWSIARAHPAPAADVETRWRAIWRHNRDVVGDDPDLIHPGQALRLPARRHDHRAEQREGRRPTMSTPDSAEAEVIVLRPSAGMASVQGALALDLTPRTAPPRPRLRSTRASDLADAGARRPGSRWTPSSAATCRPRSRSPPATGRSASCCATRSRRSTTPVGPRPHGQPPPAASHRAGSGDPTRRGRSWSAYAPP